MTTDVSAGLTAQASVGFSVQVIIQLAIGMLVADVILAMVSAALIVIRVRRAAAFGPRSA